MVWAENVLEPYLQSTRFTIRTDHEALRMILNMTDANCRLSLWMLRHSVFDYEVFYRAAVKNQAADVLSRLETAGADRKPIDDYIPLLLIAEDGNMRYIC